MARRKMRSRDTESGHDAVVYHGPFGSSGSMSDTTAHRIHSRSYTRKTSKRGVSSMFGW